MTREKRKMIRVLDRDLFDTNKKAIARFEGETVEQLGGTQPKPFLSDSRLLGIMSRTCASLWGVGDDLHLASQRGTHAMVNKLVGDLVDEHISELVTALADWSGLTINYSRQGQHLTFRFTESSGESKELRIPLRPQPEQPEQRSVH